MSDKGNEKVQDVMETDILENKTEDTEKITLSERFGRKGILYLVLDAVILFAFMFLPWLTIIGMFTGSGIGVPFSMIAASDNIGFIQKLLGLISDINVSMYYNILIVFSFVFLLVPLFIVIGLVFLFAKDDIDKFERFSRCGMVTGIVFGVILIVIELIISGISQTMLIGLVSDIAGGVAEGIQNTDWLALLKETGLSDELTALVSQLAIVLDAGTYGDAVTAMIQAKINNYGVVVAKAISNNLFNAGSGVYLVFITSLIGICVPRIAGLLNKRGVKAPKFLEDVKYEKTKKGK